mmetsp:Transcript_7900/g.29134  ORF Transcript_7900/g.29134 Transcript_7900/m.29134 type:complete len:204 (+) Transcript_7900:818-1429(+)
MSRVPPLKPRQFAKMNKGKFSALLKSRIAVAVLCALSGNQTWPAWAKTASRDSGLAGSAGIRCSIKRVSTAMTPHGMPPRRARPVTTDLPQSGKVSVHELTSKKPFAKPPSVLTPASMLRGSYGVFVGMNSILRSTGSEDLSAGDLDFDVAGTYDNHLRIDLTPSWSSATCKWDTPLGIITCGPPSWSWLVYTSRPRSLFNAK